MKEFKMSHTFNKCKDLGGNINALQTLSDQMLKKLRTMLKGKRVI